MLRLATFRSAPLAFAYWSGIAGREERAEPVARLLCFHGTPRYRAAELERQLRYVKRHFKIVSLRELVARLHGKSANIARMLAVTFDDGLRNNVTVAYPILRRLGIAGTFFVCPGLIEQRTWLWNHEARQRLRFAKEGLRRELAAHYGTSADVEGFVEWMKTLDLASRRAVENALRAATLAYRPSAEERHEFDLARWFELRALDRSLITLASHGMTHAILPYLKPDELEFEVAQSRRTLEAHVDRPIDLFAYPNGDHNPLVLDVVRGYYSAAVTCAAGWARSTSDLHLLPRIAPPRGALRLALLLHEREVPRRPWRKVRPTAAGASV